MNRYSLLVFLLTTLAITGCYAAAGAAGAQAGYLAAQEERTTGETIDDQVIYTRVKSTLFGDREVSGFDIGVRVRKGVVELRGYLDSQEKINHAVELVRSVRGVKAVDSRLVLDT